MQIDTETAHHLVIGILKSTERSPKVRRVLTKIFHHEDTHLRVNVAGLKFANPIGLAAGFDKNAQAPNTLACLGFGHVEVGTVTRNPQKGNPRPRIFRLSQEQALVNKMGFPNDGVKMVEKRLNNHKRTFILGTNLGPNKDRLKPYEAALDLNFMIDRLTPWTDYIAINISSPNTVGLKDLQERRSLFYLLSALTICSVPIFLKVSPDLTYDQLGDILQMAFDHNIEGIIATNTTSTERGGLSGKPLQEKTNKVIKFIYQETKGEMPVIGVGGVFTAQDAWEKFRAGASLVQLYTSFVYSGPFITKRINQGLSAILDKEGIKNITPS